MICHSCLKEKGGMDMCSNCIANQHKAEKLDKYENENWIAVERKVWELERQENKQLRAEVQALKYERVDLLNRCKTLEVEGS